MFSYLIGILCKVGFWVSWVIQTVLDATGIKVDNLFHYNTRPEPIQLVPKMITSLMVIKNYFLWRIPKK